MQKNTSILKIAIIAIILIITISIIYLVIPKDKEKKLKKIENPINLKFEDIIQNNILFSNIKILKKNNIYYLTAKVTNISSNSKTISPIKITLKDKQNKEIIIDTYIGDTLELKEEKNINVETKQNLKNIKNIDINIKTQVKTDITPLR